jgi:RNA polymerase sigma-B factor
MTATLSCPPQSTLTPLDDLDAAVDALFTALADTTDPAQRAVLEERIVLLALPLADSIAKRYVLRGIETDDLVQVGRTALVKAMRRYRPGAGPGFCAFAAPTVSGEIKRWFRDHGWAVRPPRRVQELRASLVAEEERMLHALAREPHDRDLADALGVTARDVAEARQCSAGYRSASLDAAGESGPGLGDLLLVTESPADALGLLDALRWALSRLPERQQLIIRLRFVDELTQAEIGERIGVSQMQVSRLLKAALARLRADLDDDAREGDRSAA